MRLYVYYFTIDPRKTKRKRQTIEALEIIKKCYNYVHIYNVDIFTALCSLPFYSISSWDLISSGLQYTIIYDVLRVFSVFIGISGESHGDGGSSGQGDPTLLPGTQMPPPSPPMMSILKGNESQNQCTQSCAVMEAHLR